MLPAYERCRLEAVAALERQAARMRRNAEQKLGKLLLEEGDLVRISVPDVDRGRLDPPALCMVVVEVCEFDAGRDVKYRLAAAKGGVLDRLYCRFDLEWLPGADATLLESFQETMQTSWWKLPSTSLRKLNSMNSITGGQGFALCHCRGNCRTNRCACFKARRLCTKRCHRGNARCCNVEHDDDVDD